MGNFSMEIDNPTIGSNLILSVWPWIPGLVAHTNWTWQIDTFKSANTGFFEGEINYNLSTTYAVGNFERTAVSFDYKQNITKGNQNTTLIYDKETGVLLYGFSEIQFLNYYVIELKLDSSSLVTQSNVPKTNSTPIDTFYSFLGLMTLAVVFVLVKNKRKIV